MQRWLCAATTACKPGPSLTAPATSDLVNLVRNLKRPCTQKRGSPGWNHHDRRGAAILLHATAWICARVPAAGRDDALLKAIVDAAEAQGGRRASAVGSARPARYLGIFTRFWLLLLLLTSCLLASNKPVNKPAAKPSNAGCTINKLRCSHEAICNRNSHKPARRRT